MINNIEIADCAILIECHHVTLTFELRIYKCVQLFYKLLSINWPNMRKIRGKIADKTSNTDSRKEINKKKEKTIQQQKGFLTLSADIKSAKRTANRHGSPQMLSLHIFHSFNALYQRQGNQDINYSHNFNFN